LNQESNLNIIITRKDHIFNNIIKYTGNLKMKADGHSAITKAAIESLPEEEQKWLGKEKDFLIEIYCHIPDLNWPWFGEWGGEPGNPNESRMPDVRREWNVSYYCGWDPLRKEGDILPPARNILPPSNPKTSIYPKQNFQEARYCPMGAYWAPAFYFPKIMAALEEGAFEDGIRFMGVLLHHIEDRGAFQYWPDLHKIGNLEDLNTMQINDYNPAILGNSVEEACANIEKKMREISRFEKERVPILRTAYKNNDQSKIEEMILEIWQETCRATADLIHTAIFLTDGERYSNYWGYWLEFPRSGNPTMLNLVDNPSFEKDDASGHPDGWFVNWKNLDDKFGRAEWDNSSMHSVFSKNVRSGERSIKLMWTPQEGIEWLQRQPSAIKTIPGEKYNFSGWIKTNDWTRVSFDFTIPENADRIRVGCSSRANEGAAWFDDVEIIRLEQ
jgi:hypothetical protein